LPSELLLKFIPTFAVVAPPNTATLVEMGTPPLVDPAVSVAPQFAEAVHVVPVPAAPPVKNTSAACPKFARLAA
jgi:hypothetical protein